MGPRQPRPAAHGAPRTVDCPCCRCAVPLTATDLLSQLETKGRKIIACQNLVNAEHLVPGYKVEIRDNRRWLPAVIVVSVCSARPALPSALPSARWLSLTDVAAPDGVLPPACVGHCRILRRELREAF